MSIPQGNFCGITADFDQGNTDSIVVRFHSWIFMQSKESSDANSELFKEDDDEAMYKNPYEIRLCD